jgi:hypothetical protein
MEQQQLPVHRIGATTFVIGTAVVVVIVGLLAAIVTWAFHPKAKTPCTLNCAGTTFRASGANALLDERYVYKSPTFGFKVEFGEFPWKVASTNATSASFYTARNGYFEVTGIQGAQSPTQLIQKRMQGLNTQNFPDLRAVGPIRGAHIGDQDATGELFESTFVPTSGQSFLVGIGAMVATRNGVTVLAFVIAPYNQNHDALHGGLDPNAGDIDWALDEFLWPGE